MKEFLRPTAAKIILFVVIVLLLLYLFFAATYAGPNNIGASGLFELAAYVIGLYLFLSALLYTFKGGKKTTIGIIIILILIGILCMRGFFSDKAHNAAIQGCVQQTGKEIRSNEWIKCMTEKGYPMIR